MKSINDKINLGFGSDKCIKVTFKQGKLISITLNDNIIIKNLEQSQNGAWKSLGINEREMDPSQQHEGKGKIKQKY